MSRGAGPGGSRNSKADDNEVRGEGQPSQAASRQDPSHSDYSLHIEDVEASATARTNAQNRQIFAFGNHTLLDLYMPVDTMLIIRRLRMSVSCVRDWKRNPPTKEEIGAESPTRRGTPKKNGVNGKKRKQWQYHGELL